MRLLIRATKYLMNKSLRLIQQKMLLRRVNHNYQNSFEKLYPTKSLLAAQTRSVKDFSFQPLISIIVPTHNTNSLYLKECLNSVLQQSYQNFELCIVDDKSSNTEVREILDDFSESDKRIKLLFSDTKTSIATTSNFALSLATGEYVGFLDHDDLLWPNALFEVVKLLNEIPKALILYSDEDKLSADGRVHYKPFYKPDWNPDLLLRCNYLSHFLVLKRSLLANDAFNHDFDGAQDWDLVLRLTQSVAPVHIPKILYSWRAHAQSTASKDGYSDILKSNVLNSQKKLLSSKKWFGKSDKPQASKYIGFWKYAEIDTFEVEINNNEKNILDSLFLLCNCRSISKRGNTHNIKLIED